MEPIISAPFYANIDWSLWVNILNLPPIQMTQAILALGGWTVLAFLLFFAATECWVSYRQSLNTQKWQWTLLAVDVPPEQIQSPKAVEQIFAQLSGALDKPDVKEKYWDGAKQRFFSFEIISIEGYIQFLVYTENKLRDLIEASIYAQYPAAEITEVEDYVGMIPDSFPSEEYDVSGKEFGLEQDDCYPLRTYEDFEHTVTKDFAFNDPMAALLESFTRIAAGEHLWLQILIEPTPNSWKEKGIKLIKAIIEKKKSKPQTPFLIEAMHSMLEMFLKGIGMGSPEEPVKKKEESAGKISDLTPGGKDTVSAIENKISKIGFKTKLRVLYIAKKEIYNPSRCMEMIVGAINQFYHSARNSLQPKWGTKKIKLKNKLIKAYKKRKLKVGKNPFILNIEELATLWHFPTPLVKTPLLQKSATKKAEAPINLPVESIESPLIRKMPSKPVEVIAPPPEPEELLYG